MHCKNEEPCRVVVERVCLRTTLEPGQTSCVASLTPVVARFIEHLTTVLPDKSADYHDTRFVVARFPVVARFIELCLMNQAPEANKVR